MTKRNQETAATEDEKMEQKAGEVGATKRAASPLPAERPEKQKKEDDDEEFSDPDA